MTYIIIGTDGDFGWDIDDREVTTHEEAMERAKAMAISHPHLTRLIIVDQKMCTQIKPRVSVSWEWE